METMEALILNFKDNLYINDEKIEEKNNEKEEDDVEKKELLLDHSTLKTYVDEFRQTTEPHQGKKLLEKIQNSLSLLEKCILSRKHISCQSTLLETIVKNDLNIENKKNETSGDGCKNGVTFEIKISIHGKSGKFNFVQIRPDHQIDYYIMIAYNIYEEDLGKAYIMKIPSSVIYELVCQYGGYAHGTKKVLGDISRHVLYGRQCEYALRPTAIGKKNSKGRKLWDIMQTYDVTYSAVNF